MATKRTRHRQISPALVGIYLATLLISFHYFLVVYVNSAFITDFITEQHVGTFYLIAALFSSAIFIYFVRLLRKLGNFNLISIFLTIEALSLLGLIFVSNTFLLIGLFLVHLAMLPVLYLNLDIFLEKLIQSEGRTGRTRGMFLSMLSIASVLSPFVVGLLLTNNEYWKVYALATGFILLAFAVIFRRLRTFEDPEYTHRSVRQTLRQLFKNRDFSNVFVAQFLLRFFFSWMVIYMPIYLFRYVGFDWTEIGIIFTVMLLPFLLLDIPLGHVADRIGEKEIMVIGFLVLACSAALIPLVTTAWIFWWAGLLFVTRIGACMIEVGTESYFFKKVDGEDAAIISAFRLTRPVSRIFAAGVASIALISLPFQWSFLVLAFIMLFGVHYAVHIRDTK